MTYTPVIRAHEVRYAWPRIAGGHTYTASFFVKITECKPCTVIGKNLKSVIPAKQFHPHIPYVEPNQEIQIYFGGQIFEEKGNKIYFLAAIDRFSKYPTACIYEKAKGSNVPKFLDMYVENHGIPRSIRLDQAKFLVGNRVKTFCNKKLLI